jgi:hypothetical protein
MYLSEKHDGSAARTAGAIAFSSLSIKLSTLEKRHRLHTLSVAPISNRSACSLYGYMGGWMVRMSKTRTVETNMPLTRTKKRYP